jgi:penicillin-binding protein 1C
MRMVEAGVIDLDTARASQRDAAPLGRRPMPQLAPHLADRAVAQGEGRHDLTLDGALQASLEHLVQRHMTGRDPRLSMAVVIADHTSGEVLASVGSPVYEGGESQGFVDMTVAQRSPGSTLKPLVYGLAFDRGLAHPETLILDAPVQFGTYAPQNFDGVFRGELPVRQALQLSLNIPVVRLTEALGPALLMAALDRAGVRPGLAGGTAGLALSLGGVGVTLEDMVQLYAALARGGQMVGLNWRQQPMTPGKRVINAASAWQVGHILSQIPPPPAGGPVGRVAYKTGTSYGHRDAWALGWDGRHVAGVWIGRPDGTPVPGAFGGDLAAPLLFEALGQARGGKPAPLPAPPPETLILSHATLPMNLRRFGPIAEAPALQMAFPPNGAVLEAMEGGVPIRLRGGTPPYTLMVDGTVLDSGLRRANFVAPVMGPGFTELTVIDRLGQSARAQIDLRAP